MVKVERRNTKSALYNYYDYPMMYLKSFTLTFYYKALNEQKWIYEIPHSVRNDSSHSVV